MLYSGRKEPNLNMSRRRNKSHASEAQILANQINALRSTGPRTEAGKNRSSCNAFRHGLTAQVTVMTDPDREAQDKFIKAYVADLAPEGAQETQLAQAIAFDTWRMNRTRAIEENAFSIGFSGQPGQIDCSHPQIHSAMSNARTFFDDAKTFSLLSVYEQRIHRNFHRNLKLYRELKAERQTERPAEPKTAPTAQPAAVVIEIEKPLTMTAAASAPATPSASETTTQPIPETNPQPPVASITSSQIGFVHSNPDQTPQPTPPTAHKLPPHTARSRLTPTTQMETHTMPSHSANPPNIPASANLINVDLEKTLLRKVGEAIHRFKMIRNGDRIAVAVSGGKDSVTLLEALLLLQKRAPIDFTVCAFTVEQGKFLAPVAGRRRIYPKSRRRMDLPHRQPLPPPPRREARSRLRPLQPLPPPRRLPDRPRP